MIRRKFCEQFFTLDGYLH